MLLKKLTFVHYEEDPGGHHTFSCKLNNVNLRPSIIQLLLNVSPFSVLGR